MLVTVDFPGGARVDAHWDDFTLKTDQPRPTGDNSAPSPFDVFLGSIGACAGVYVLSFCRQRGISTDGLKLVQRLEVDPATGLVNKILLDIVVPPDFPDKYRGAVIHAAEQCTVKKHLEHPPSFKIQTVVSAPGNIKAG